MFRPRRVLRIVSPYIPDPFICGRLTFGGTLESNVELLPIRGSDRKFAGIVMGSAWLTL